MSEREMTLDEWCGKLVESHGARKELAALREERDLLDYTCRVLTKRNEDLCWTPVGRPDWDSAMLKIAAKLLSGEKATMEDGHTLASAARGAREEWDTARSELSRLRARIAELEGAIRFGLQQQESDGRWFWRRNNHAIYFNEWFEKMGTALAAGEEK